MHLQAVAAEAKAEVLAFWLEMQLLASKKDRLDNIGERAPMQRLLPAGRENIPARHIIMLVRS